MTIRVYLLPVSLISDYCKTGMTIDNQAQCDPPQFSSSGPPFNSLTSQTVWLIYPHLTINPLLLVVL